MRCARGDGASARPASPASSLAARRRDRAQPATQLHSAAHRRAGLPYERWAIRGTYLASTFLGRRTAAHQAALGCRFRCTFCGVAAMFRGAHRAAAGRTPRARPRATSSTSSAPTRSSSTITTSSTAKRTWCRCSRCWRAIELPWWCFARADALREPLRRSPGSWCARAGCAWPTSAPRSPNDQLLQAIRKGTRSDQTLEVAELCRRNGVIPELSFMVAPPEDPEGETERTFEFIRAGQAGQPGRRDHRLHLHAAAGEQRARTRARLRLRAAARPARRAGGVSRARRRNGPQRRWVDYACHADAPWLSDRLRQRIRDFVTVLRCRFPTVQDMRSPRWAKRACARWRRGAIATPLRSAVGTRASPTVSCDCACRRSRASSRGGLARRADQFPAAHPAGARAGRACWSDGIRWRISPRRRPVPEPACR